MSNNARKPNRGPFYLLSPTGGTVKLVGPKAQEMADFHVKEFGLRMCTQTEWQSAHQKQKKEAP